MPELITKYIATSKGLMEFRIEPLQINTERLYAIYCNYAGRTHCFHMKEDENSYTIMDLHNCPYDLKDLTTLLSKELIAL